MQSSIDSHSQLMLEFKNGDNAGFNKLLELYRKPIINMIYKMVGDRISAEDLAQEVFLRVYKSKNSYQPRAKFSTWIYKIATNISLNYLRYKRRHRAESLDAKMENEGDEMSFQIADEHSPNARQDLERRELQEKIKQAIESLPEKQRAVVILAKFQELSQKDIAGVLNCSVMAVKLHLYRARKALKEKLAGYLETT